MSKIKSLIYSLYVAPFKKYDKNNFNQEYFSNFQNGPATARAQIFIDFFKSEKILDVGCGTGNLVWGFNQVGANACGVDLSDAAIEKSSEEIKPFLKVGNIFNLDYPDNEFDLVTCCDVMEHLPFPECDQAMDELFRVSRNWILCHICLWTDKNARLDPTHINLHSKWWWNKYFREKGYTLVKTPKNFPSRKNCFIIKKGS